MNRTQRRQRERITQKLRAHIAKHGIEPFLDQLFGPGTWSYDAQEHLWVSVHPPCSPSDSALTCS